MSAFWQVLAIGFAGACGTLARFGVNQFTAKALGDYPYGTVIVNVAGCFLFGFLTSIFSAGRIGVQYKVILLTGFLGGFTTFSAYAYEIADFLEHQRYLAALLHFGGQNVLGIAAVFLGLCFGKYIFV
ncbi:MAG: fluoride efflux transporter CrcB [Planctomycetaceae bacterium]|jgi:CrcB protein|nr:fluoride efflux transporter CrcB [Planctomycetaceae bacterium]